jgi:hypothetical protein
MIPGTIYLILDINHPSITHWNTVVLAGSAVGLNGALRVERYFGGARKWAIGGDPVLAAAIKFCSSFSGSSVNICEAVTLDGRVERSTRRGLIAAVHMSRIQMTRRSIGRGATIRWYGRYFGYQPTR